MMKVNYRLVSWRTGKTIRQFSTRKDFNYSISEYIGEYKILGLRKLEYSNKKYYTFTVLHWSDRYALVPSRKPWYYNQNLLNLVSLGIFAIILLSISAIVKLIQIWLR